MAAVKEMYGSCVSTLHTSADFTLWGKLPSASCSQLGVAVGTVLDYLFIILLGCSE